MRQNPFQRVTQSLPRAIRDRFLLVEVLVMFRATIVSLVGLIIATAPCLGQSKAYKFNPKNTVAEIEHVFDDGANSKTFKGAIGEVLPNRNVVLNLYGKGPSVAARSMQKLPPQVQGLPLDVTVRREDDEVVVTKVQPSVVTAWENAEVSKPGMAKLDESVKALDATFQSFIESETPSRQQFARLAATAEDVQREFLVSYEATPAGNTEELDELARLYPAILEFRKKAIIGFDDNYWPEVYEKMHRHSRAVVAIARKGSSDAIGSGSLIGNNLILTCAHVFPDDDDVQNYEVWFDYERTSVDPQPQTRKFPIKKLVYQQVPAGSEETPLDVMLLELGVDGAGKTSQEYGFKPLPLTKIECRLDDPVYVIGHPRGNVRTVHDNARIIFPHRSKGSTKADIDARVRAEILAFVGSMTTDSAERQRNQKLLLDRYEASFVKEEATGFFRYVNPVRGPAIGIDTDTYAGDSGAPTFLRRGSGSGEGIIGVFVGGAVQGAEKAGFLTHEVVLPISEVLQVLDTDPSLGNWKATYAVNVQAP